MTTASMVTDVRPAVAGRCIATCDCGLYAVVRSEQDGWTWVLDHDCQRPSGGTGGDATV